MRVQITDEAVENTVAENGTVAAVAQASMPSVVAITSVSVQEIPSSLGMERGSIRVREVVPVLSWVTMMMSF